jgi:hypothetical protein
MVWLPGEWLKPAATVKLVTVAAQEDEQAPWRNADHRHNGPGRSPIQTVRFAVASGG